MKRLVSIGGGIALSIFIIVTIFSYTNMGRLIALGKTRTSIFDIVERLESLLTYSNAAESGINQYLLTEDIGYLKAYYDGREIIEKELQDLRRIMADNAGQQQRFDTLDRLIAQRFENLREAVEQRQKKGFDAGTQSRLLGEGEKLEDAIRTVVTRMVGEEKSFLRSLEMQMEAAGRSAFAAMSLGTFMSFVILYRILHLLYRENAERRRAEDALRLSERRLSLIVENLPAGTLQREGSAVFFNKAVEEITGYTRSEITTLDQWFTSLYGAKADVVRGYYEEDRAAGFPGTRTVPVIRKDGQTRYVELASYLYDEEKEVWLLHDVTERKKAEKELERLSRTYESILKSVGEGIFGMDREGRGTFVNRTAADMLGYTEKELIGLDMHALVHHTKADGSVYPHEECLIFKSLQEGVVQQSEDEMFWKKDGTSFPVEYISTPIIEGGEVAGVVVAFREITERKRNEESLSKYVGELERRNREIELLSGMVSMLQACVSIEEACAVIGASLQKLFSGESGAVYLFSPTRNTFEPVVLWGEERPREDTLEAKECWALRLGRVYTMDSSDRGMRCPHVADALQAGYICVPLTAQGETMGLLHLRFGAQWLHPPEEMREQRKAVEKLVEAVAESIALSLANFRLRETLFEQSTHDSLTTLCNRRSMDELMERELHRMARKGQTMGIIMLDIDHFKSFNDVYGHKAGDMLLRELGFFLKRSIREEDYACRYGGEEFVIILPETTPEQGRFRAEQVRKRFKEVRFHYEGKIMPPVTLSLGVAFFPQHGATAGELLRAADAALYRAKAEGRDRVETV
ncbi:MAG: diguanylate cyclase [Thermodesulfovibrionales bacterium]